MTKRSGYSRREVLRLGSTLSVLAVAYVPGCGSDDSLPEYDFSGTQGPADLFQHGVASGDPLDDAVILWTRVTVDGNEPVEVFWEMATDVDFRDRVAADWTVTDGDRDYTVKLDVAGLRPGTSYYYRFWALGRASLVGRTRTAPRGEVDRIRLAVMSCASFAHGYFHAYRDVAARDDVDAVLHLGDYIYEYGTGEYGTVRAYEPAHEIVTLEDYRRRYSQYRRDPDLQAAHGQLPFVCIWDDHEIANDAWRGGAQNHTEPSAAGPGEGPYEVRSAAAKRVFSEWMPVRDQPDGRIFRSFSFGDLIDLIVLDTRHWDRDRQDPSADALADPQRTMLGVEQESWLGERLASSRADWRFIGQQVVFGPILVGGAVLNPDQWDGYPAARQRVFDAIEGVDGVVVLSGDLHSSGAAELARDPFQPASYDPATGEGSLAVEFVTPGVTSPAFAAGSNQTVLPAILAENRHIHFADIENRGYMIVDTDRQRAQATWYHYPQTAIESRRAEPVIGAVFATYRGTNRLVEE